MIKTNEYEIYGKDGQVTLNVFKNYESPCDETGCWNSEVLEYLKKFFGDTKELIEIHNNGFQSGYPDRYECQIIFQEN